MERLVAKHSRATRWFHWINVPLLSLMIYSGLLINWANNVYAIGWGNVTLVKLFPEILYDVLGMNYRLAEGMAWHFTIMWFFVINGIAYVSYTFLSGEWRELVPTVSDFPGAWRVLLLDLQNREQPRPQRKYNSAQKLAYSAVIVMAAGSIVTGLAIYKPTQLAWLTFCCGGYQGARLIHFGLTMGFMLFIGIHLIQVGRAGWNTLRGMVTGFEIVSSQEQSHV